MPQFLEEYENFFLAKQDEDLSNEDEVNWKERIDEEQEFITKAEEVRIF